MNRHSQALIFLLAMVCQSNLLASDNKTYLMWQVHPHTPKSKILELSAMGVNTVQSFSFLYANKNDVKKFMKTTHESQLRVIPYIGHSISRTDSGVCTIDKIWTLHLDYISSFPSLYAWQTFDEPYFKENSDAQCQLDIYRELKLKYPTIKILISLNNTENFHFDKNFTIHSADIFDIHAYADPNPSLRQNNLFQQAEIHLLPSEIKEIIFTLRAFNNPDQTWKDTSAISMNRVFEVANKFDSKLDGYGFYGWDLNPNIGIDKTPDLKQGVISILKNLRN